MREFDELDSETVERVMENELRRLAGDPSAGDASDAVWRAAESAMSLAYGMAYLNNYGGEVARRIYGLMCQSMGPGIPAEAGLGDVTDEWLCGRALAISAWSHANADLDLAMDRFDERAVTALDDGLESLLDCEPPDRWRLDGVSPELGQRSAQAVSARDVEEIAGDVGHDVCSAVPSGMSASDVLSPADMARVARDFAESLGGVELGYDDIGDIRSRVTDLVAERASEADAPSDGVDVVARVESGPCIGRDESARCER